MPCFVTTYVVTYITEKLVPYATTPTIIVAHYDALAIAYISQPFEASIATV